MSVLFRPTLWAWGPIEAQFVRVNAAPEDALIANVNIVPFVGEDVVWVRHTSGDPDMIGGTREPGEALHTTIARELLEEAGARLTGAFVPFGAWQCHSLQPQPYRPHLPHPDFFRLVVVAAVEVIALPSNPPGAEQIAAVMITPVADAAAAFRAAGREDLAELYELAGQVWRSGGQPEA